MSGEANVKPVNIDPQCIQEALRMYFQPIKHDDTGRDFYTMYKRETMEYDTEYMQKYNEDLNTTLIFAGLFSAVSSAFVIAVQSNLQPDSGERSEAYLRAILFNLNRSAAPDEDPTGPPAWNGPPAEVIAAMDLLYASLLMSLLAAFVAMLGKQWLNRYLRHAGGSMVERCGDRQRKFDGLERWPFRMFIESLPIMLQIALLLLACGLSRYMWSVDTSVARVVISFTVLGVLFYIGIVAAGAWSYECPFQTPASMVLRYLRESGTTRKLLGRLSLHNIISLTNATRKNARKLLIDLSLPNTTSLIYASWVDTHHGIVLASHRALGVMRCSLSWEISLSRIIPGIRNAATKVGHRAIILLLRIDRAFGNTKQRLAQGIRRFKRTELLPITIEGADRQQLVLRNGPVLWVRVRNLKKIRSQNADNAHCVCWVLRNISDPEAIDSAIRLAGTIRWFYHDPNLTPPFDLIVSTFEACFDSTKQLYPGMRDRAYFSARAILQINAGARLALCCGHASKYQIPTILSNSCQNTDPDLHNILHMLEFNSGRRRPILNFPTGGTNTHAHLLWMSNLFVYLTCAGPNPILESYWSYLSAAITNHQPMVANVLLMWYMLLGGHVKEETLWAVDKSDSLETILSHLSTRVMDVIRDGNRLEHLYYLLEFLAAWKERPMCLIPIAYQWLSAISEAAAGKTSTIQHFLRDKLALELELKLEFDNICPKPNGIYTRWGCRYGLRLRLGRGPVLSEDYKFISPTLDSEFHEAGPGCDPANLGGISNPHCGCKYSSALTPLDYARLLSMTLEIGFRHLTSPCHHRPDPDSNHTSHHNWMFEIAFSSNNDEVIADALCAWIVYDNCTPSGSCLRYFAERVERDTPFSPRLRHLSICAIENIWQGGLEVSGFETIRLLNRLDVDMDDEVAKREWGKLLVDVICSPAGPKSLSPHYWRLLGKLLLFVPLHEDPAPRTMEVMRSLEEAEDWEKLEIWMVIAWQSQPLPQVEEDVGQVIHKLLLRRPSALPRLEDICETGMLRVDHKVELRRICDKARTEQSPSESSPLQSVHTQPLVLIPFEGDDSF